LKKSLLADERNFSGRLVRPARGNVRDYIGSHKSDHRPSYPPYSGLQRQRQLKTDLGEIFGAAQLSPFSTISARSGGIAIASRRRGIQPARSSPCSTSTTWSGSFFHRLLDGPGRIVALPVLHVPLAREALSA